MELNPISSGPPKQLDGAKRLELGGVPQELSDLFARFDLSLRESVAQQKLTWASAKNVRRHVRLYIESVQTSVAAAPGPESEADTVAQGRVREALFIRPSGFISAHLAQVSDKYSRQVGATVKASISKFYAWLKAEGLSDFDSADIINPGVTTRHQRVAAIDEWLSTLQSADSTKVLVKSRVHLFFQHVSDASGIPLFASSEIAGLERVRRMAQTGGEPASSITELVCVQPGGWISSYLQHLKDKHGNNGQVLKYPLSALRQFYLWLVKEKLVGELPNELRQVRNHSGNRRAPSPPRKPILVPLRLDQRRARRMDFPEPQLDLILKKRDEAIDALIKDPDNGTSFEMLRKMSRAHYGLGNLLWLPSKEPVGIPLSTESACCLREYVKCLDCSKLATRWQGESGRAPLFVSGDGGSLTADDAEDALELPLMFFEQRDRAVTELVRHSRARFAEVIRLKRIDLAGDYDRFYPHAATGAVVLPRAVQLVLRNYCEIINGSELGYVWAMPSSGSPLFLSADGRTLTADSEN